MSLDDIVGIAEKILPVPRFCSDGESQLGIAASLFEALIGAVIGRLGDACHGVAGSWCA